MSNATATLQAAVGPDGAWEAWMTLDTTEKAEQAAKLVEKAPGRWRVVLG